jgi:large subunit ribosomal protein LP0
MGKNTLMRMIMREQIAANPKLEALVPQIRGNMGLIFTNGDLSQIRTIVTANKVPAVAKTGTIAPTDVFVPAGPTGLDPGQTSFFQALNIGTKIVRGAIEIANEVHLIKKGDKVTSSAVALLGKLDIKPFFYGCVVKSIYENGAVYPVEILDITPEDLMGRFFSGVRRIAAIGLAIGYPTEASLGHNIANGFKKLLALSATSGYQFKESEAFFSKAAAPAAEEKKEEKPAAAAAGGKGKEKKKEEEAPAEEEDDGTGGGFGGMFD